MANIIDVARAASVSPMTVSRYFNAPERLRPETRERVRQAVETLRYVPNEAARSLVRGATHSVALVVPDLSNPFFTAVSRGVEGRASDAGYTLIVANTGEDGDRERTHLEALLRRRVDGLLRAPVATGGSADPSLRLRRPAQVLIDRRVPAPHADVIVSDSFDGGRQLVEHLVAQGYRDIAFLGGTPGVSSLEDRLNGYRIAMQGAGLVPRAALGRFDRASGERLVDELVATRTLPEAIVAANNLVAIGALTALRRHGLDVPRDVAVVAFGDIELAAAIDPFLTVIAHPAERMGALAFDLLLDRMRGYEGPPRVQVLPVELVVRRSAIRAR
ncbi:MAG: LacI family transcriptional regulator [Gemmatimonadaceae bacterium]|jgi:LacI family transcriptional regulator|nr:LacI family transcriptional regulator [Gemmatimonadaceae bacterium]